MGYPIKETDFGNDKPHMITVGDFSTLARTLKRYAIPANINCQIECPGCGRRFHAVVRESVIVYDPEGFVAHVEVCKPSQ